MHKTLVPAVALAVLFATAALGDEATKQSTPPAQAPSADEQAVRLLADAFVKAYNAGDAKAVAALFVADGEIVNEARESRQGQAEIERAFGEFFQSHPKAKIAVSIESVRVLSPTTAVEDGDSTVTSPSGQTIERNRYMVVYAKQDGAWKMATARDLPGEPASSAEELKDLQWLIGDWVDETSGATVVTSYRSAEDGRAILSDFHVRVAGKPAMTGTQRIAWDPSTRKLHSWVHDSEGGFAEGVWTRDGKRWIVKVNGVSHDGRVASSTNVLTHVGKDRMTWQSRDRVVGDELMPNVDPVVVVRKAPSPQ
jgi:uncharacterized protein (TIGR02246 family)